MRSTHPLRLVPALIPAALALLWIATGCSPGQSGAMGDEMLSFSIDDANASHPTTAIDPGSGAVYVAYAGTRSGVTDVYFRRLEAGAEAVGAPVRVNDVAGDAAVHGQAPAQVVAAPDGSVYVAWITQTPVEGRRFPASDIRVARSANGGRSFEPAVTASGKTDFPTGHHFHNLAVGPDGTVYVSWLDSEARDRAQQSSGAEAAMRGDGHGHGAHGGGGLPGTQLKVARSSDGGRTFERGVVVADGTCQCCRTALTTASDGTVYVAWRHIFGDHIRDMALARSDDGGRTFGEPVRVHADNWQIDGCPHAGPAVAVDEGGQVFVIWYTGADDRQGVFYASSDDGGQTFGPAESLASGVPISQVGAITAAPGEGALLTWENSRKDSIFAGYASGSRLDLLGGMPGGAPAVASSDDREVIAWREGARTHLRILRRPALAGSQRL